MVGNLGEFVDLVCGDLLLSETVLDMLLGFEGFSMELVAENPQQSKSMVRFFLVTFSHHPIL